MVSHHNNYTIPVVVVPCVPLYLSASQAGREMLQILKGMFFRYKTQQLLGFSSASGMMTSEILMSGNYDIYHDGWHLNIMMTSTFRTMTSIMMISRTMTYLGWWHLGWWCMGLCQMLDPKISDHTPTYLPNFIKIFPLLWVELMLATPSGPGVTAMVIT